MARSSLSEVGGKMIPLGLVVMFVAGYVLGHISGRMWKK